MLPCDGRRVADPEAGRPAGHQTFAASRRLQAHGNVKEARNRHRLAVAVGRDHLGIHGDLVGIKGILVARGDVGRQLDRRKRRDGCRAERHGAQLQRARSASCAEATAGINQRATAIVPDTVSGASLMARVLNMSWKAPAAI